MSRLRPSLGSEPVRWLVWGGLAGLGATALALAIRPGLALAGWPPCLFHELSGWHCPGCGATRALLACAGGNLGAAFGRNPLLMILLLFLPWAIWRRDRLSSIRPAWMWALVTVVVGFAVLRNVPAPAFQWLAP